MSLLAPHFGDRDGVPDPASAPILRPKVRSSGPVTTPVMMERSHSPRRMHAIKRRHDRMGVSLVAATDRVRRAERGAQERAVNVRIVVSRENGLATGLTAGTPTAASFPVVSAFRLRATGPGSTGCGGCGPPTRYCLPT